DRLHRRVDRGSDRGGRPAPRARPADGAAHVRGTVHLADHGEQLPRAVSQAPPRAGSDGHGALRSGRMIRPRESRETPPDTERTERHDQDASPSPAPEEAHESEKDSYHLPFYTLRGGAAFVLCDPHGDLLAGQHGYFVKDTRMLSRFELFVAEKKTS